MRTAQRVRALTLSLRAAHDADVDGLARHDDVAAIEQPRRFDAAHDRNPERTERRFDDRSFVPPFDLRGTHHERTVGEEHGTIGEQTRRRRIRLAREFGDGDAAVAQRPHEDRMLGLGAVGDRGGLAGDRREALDGEARPEHEGAGEGAGVMGDIGSGGRLQFGGHGDPGGFSVEGASPAAAA